MDGRPTQDLPEGSVPIASAPIIPGFNHGPLPFAPLVAPVGPPQVVTPYFVSTLPSDIQRGCTLVRTGYQTAGASRTPLMPVGANGMAQTNAATQTIIVNNSTTSGGTVVATGLSYRGAWNSFTPYHIDDLVLSGSLLYLAIAAGVNQPPASSPIYWVAFAGEGTVTSVALTVPSIFALAGSPITTAGTLAVTLATQTANTIFAGPAAGLAAVPTFRILALADIPNLPASIITSGQLALAQGGTHADLSATGGSNKVLKQLSTGADITVAQLAASELTGYVAANLATQTANVSATTLVAASAGLYRVTVYIVVSQAASSTSTLPDTQIIYTDRDSNATITIQATVGDATNTTSTFAQATFVVNAKNATNLQYAIGQVNAYASSGGTPMQFAYRVRAEYLG